MKTINIFLDDLGAKQSVYSTILHVNNLYKNNKDIDVIIFYDSATQFCLTPLCGVMHSIEGWEQDGIGIATSYNTLDKILTYPMLEHIIYYMWDLEFLRMRPKQYDIARDLMRHPKVKIIARNITHAALVKNNFNRKVDAIIKDFDIPQILELVELIEKDQKVQ